MAKRHPLSHDRVFWGQLLAALMPLTISSRWPAIIGWALLKLAASCWAEGTWGNSKPCVIVVIIFAGMSIISTKSGRNLPGQGPGTSASWMGWSWRMMSKRWTMKRILTTIRRTKSAARRFFWRSTSWWRIIVGSCSLSGFWRFEVSHFMCLV